MKTISITKDDKGQATITLDKVILPDVIQMALALIESACKKSIETAPADMQGILAEDMFDMCNYGMATLLERTFPEISARPDLTTDAILEAENKLLEQDADKYKRALAKSPAAVKRFAERKAMEDTVKANDKAARLSNPANKNARKLDAVQRAVVEKQLHKKTTD